VRVVLRPTRAYGVLLDESWHPDLLADALDRDRFFDWLWADTERAGMASAIPFEQQSLWRGDIPCFAAYPERRDLLNWDGRLVQREFFAASAMDDARRRVRGLGERDLERQSWLIAVSLGTAVLNRNEGEWMSYALERPAEHRPPAELRQQAIAAARDLGGWFERMAVRDGDAASWVTLDFRNRLWSLSGASAELYSGTTGIVLFRAAANTPASASRISSVFQVRAWSSFSA